MATRDVGGMQRARTFAGGTRIKMATCCPSHANYCTLSPSCEETMSWHSYKQELPQPRAAVLSNRTRRDGLSQKDPANFPCWPAWPRGLPAMPPEGKVLGRDGSFLHCCLLCSASWCFSTPDARTSFWRSCLGFFTLHWRALPLASLLTNMFGGSFKLSH